MVRKKRIRIESVGSHTRKKVSGMGIVDVGSYKRRPKLKRIKFIKPFKRKYEVKYFRDDQGRIVAKRIYKPI